MPGKCHFREYWLAGDNNKDIATWLRPVSNDKFKALCLFCKKSFDISHSGFNSVKSHSSGKTHQQLTKALLTGKQTVIHLTGSNEQQSSIPTQQSSTTAVSSSDALSSSSCSGVKEFSIKNFLVNDEVTKAEIIWAATKVMTHSSDRSSSHTSDLFPILFPDSLIAQKFQMHKDKLGYVITYGLGPYFQDYLVRELKRSNCEFFCISFDESLNKVSQKGQMDMLVRYWKDDINEVSTRYLTSSFLGHSTALNLLKGLASSFLQLELDFKKVIQISVDGPNVNLKFLNDFKYFMKTEIPDSEVKDLIDTGTCSLHKVHGSFKTAHAKSEWDINKFLRALYYLFKDFPSRREDYIKYSGSTLFPQKMCSIRWVENSKVIERAVKIIPGLKKYIAAVKPNPPDSRNYHIVSEFLQDKLLSAKLLFLQSIACELETFLTNFQSNRPLLPFLYRELFCLAYSIASRFLKKEVITPVKYGKLLLDIDVEKKENLLDINFIDIGMGATSVCRRVKDHSLITKFRRQCQTFLLVLFGKLTDTKSPLLNKFVRGATSLAPNVMLGSHALRVSRITLVLDELMTKNHVAPAEADKIKADYLNLCEESSIKAKLKSFDWKKDRLDILMKDILAKNTALFKFSKIILTMFHGNADIERNFSINKECLVENLHEHSLIAQRSTYSGVMSYGGIKEVAKDITKEMITYVRRAASKRKEMLKNKKKEEEVSKNKLKNALVAVAELKERKRKVMEQAAGETDAIDKEIEAAQKILKQS